jgi:5-methylcytosine-specific restriction endonuclease McrA
LLHKEQKKARYVRRRPEIIASVKAWRAANRERHRAWNRAWKAKHPEKSRAWTEQNRDKVRSYGRRYCSTAKAKRSAYGKAYHAAHPDKALESVHRRRCRLAGGVPVPITRAHMLLLREAQDHCCRYCGTLLLAGQTHLDHRTPLARGGTHEPSNVCLACARCNLKKSTMTEPEFLVRMREVV